MTTNDKTQLTHLTNQSFDQFVKDSSLPVLIDFWAPWCGPCRILGPIMEDVAATYPEKVRVAKVNVDEQPELAARFGIRGIPTVKLFKQGQEVESVSGAHPRAFWDDVVAKVG